MVRDLVHGPDSSSPSWLVVMGDYLYFTVYTPEYGVELWRSKGTGPTMELVKDIFPGARGSHPSYLTVYGGNRLFMSANGVDTNWRLRTDACDGFRRSVVDISAPFAAGVGTGIGAAKVDMSETPDGDIAVFYTVSESTTWVPAAVYDCPLGECSRAGQV